MYVGRIAAVGRTREDRLVVMYRVSSRSYSNRQAKMVGQAVAVVPRAGFESDVFKNPYIAYNCLRLTGDHAIVGNGSHIDPLAEKLMTGMQMRDALVSTLIGMDYEHDELGTPRIAAIINRVSRSSALGIVRKDALLVREFSLDMGEALYIATYEHNYPDREFRDPEFHVTSAEEACDYVIGKGVFASLERPITAACAFESETGFSIAFKDADQKN
jgi:IMP cyclohydrolase